jgi:peptidoglycan/LPS O-acetylase OafA/YrhL
MTLPPIRALWNSHVAVGIFFQLSGFVLPLNYFKKARIDDPSANDSIISGMFRRYWRLMIPVLTSYSVYFFFKHTNLIGTDNK